MGRLGEEEARQGAMLGLGTDQAQTGDEAGPGALAKEKRRWNSAPSWPTRGTTESIGTGEHSPARF